MFAPTTAPRPARSASLVWAPDQFQTTAVIRSGEGLRTFFTPPFSRPHPPGASKSCLYFGAHLNPNQSQRPSYALTCPKSKSAEPLIERSGGWDPGLTGLPFLLEWSASGHVPPLHLPLRVHALCQSLSSTRSMSLHLFAAFGDNTRCRGVKFRCHPRPVRSCLRPVW